MTLYALGVVDGQSQAFAQAQAAHVNEFDRRAIAAQPDQAQESVDLLPSQDGRESVVILGADLGEDGPVAAAEEVEKKHPGSGQGLADRFGLSDVLYWVVRRRQK